MTATGKAREMPPPLELQCLKALWVLGEGKVGDVQQALAPHKPLAYTTVMTLLERLLRKGALTRARRGRHFVYAPAVTREALRRVAVRQLADTFFDGSPAALIRYLETSGGPPPSMADVLFD
ncbi:MAG: BlaI/MecI/CopY family transcriptional regulator [Bryobacteraceae bacterium]